MKFISSKNTKIINIILFLITILADVFAYKNLKSEFTVKSSSRLIQDTTSVYTTENAVNLLLNISKEICVKGEDAKAYDNVISDCLNNINNQNQEQTNVLISFWNTCGDYIKNKSGDNKKKINEDLIKGMISLTNNMRVKISKYHNSSCGNMLVIGKFDQDKVINQIESTFSKFNLENKPEGLYISSMASVHRNLADTKLFEKLNLGPRNDSPSLSIDPLSHNPATDAKSK